MHIKSLSEGFFSLWICTLWPISITSAFNITRITNQVSPWVVLWLWKKQVLFPSTHMGNHYNMKYAHGDGQGGTGGECNNLRQNRGRAHGTQFIPTKWVEQTLGLPCKAPLSKPVFRHEEWKQTGFINARSKTCVTYPWKEDFDAGLLQNKMQSPGLKRCCGHTHNNCAVFLCDSFWFIRVFTVFKNSAISQTWSHQITVLHRMHSQRQKDLLPSQEHPFLRVTHHPSLSIMG